jgi:hypothetical protein
MLIKSKAGVVAAAVLASVASLVLSQTAATAAHRHHYTHRHVYNYRADTGYQANAAVRPTVDPVNDPTLTGGGSPGYNVCAGHPTC